MFEHKYATVNPLFPKEREKRIVKNVVGDYSSISPGFSELKELLVYYSLLSGRTDVLCRTLPKLEKEERRAFHCESLPTVGIEIEIPFGLGETRDTQIKKYQDFANAFCVPYSIGSDHFELSPNFSYSWRTQRAFLHALSLLNCFPLSEADREKQFPFFELSDADKYSLHYNIGTPEDIANLAEYHKFNDSIRLVSIASGLAFSNPGRLYNRKTQNMVSTYKYALPSGKRKGADTDGRVEFRALGFGNRQGYEQLRIMQTFGALLFSGLRTEAGISCKNTVSDLWGEFKSSVFKILNTQQIDLGDLDNVLRRSVIDEVLATTTLSSDLAICMRNISLRFESFLRRGII